MSDTTHEGWSNYETWGVAFVIDHEPTLLAFALNLARRSHDDVATESECESCMDQLDIECLSCFQTAASDLAEILQEWIETGSENLFGDLPLDRVYTQLMEAAFASIHWHELARHYLKKASEGVT